MQPTRARWSVAVAIFFLVVPAPATAQPRPLVMDGFASLFGLKEVTVVYPAGSAANRFSAERRAGYLRAAYDMQVAVAADDAVTAEQRDGNLLVLGWENKLLPQGGGHRVIVREGDSRLFLDEMKIGRRDDLLFAWVSPYNPKRLLGFWSRIDPELDRVMTLPQVGSDWAVMRDFLVLGQGMFKEDPSWPPQRNPFGERPASEPLLMPLGPSSEHYRLHADPMLPAAEARKVLAAREAAWDYAATALGGAQEDLMVDLFVYRSQAQMRERTGMTDMVRYSIPARGELHMIQPLAEDDNPHEDIHLLARKRLGAAPISAMFEGLAVALDPSADESSLAMFASGLSDQGLVPSVAQLLDEEWLRPMVRQGIGLASAGLFVRWLRANTDEATFGRLYTLPTGAPEEVAKLLGLSTETMELRFRTWISAQAKSGKEAYAHAKVLDEARMLGSGGDRAGELAALKKALELRPADPQTLYMMSSAQLRNGEPQAAETTLRRLLEVTADAREGTAHVLGVLQLAQTLDGLGRPEEALELFESLLALPDMRDSHRRAKEAITRLRAQQGGG